VSPPFVTTAQSARNRGGATVAASKTGQSTPAVGGVETNLVKKVTALLAVPTVVLMFALRAAAVCLEPHPRVCAEFFKSEAVFVGEVVSQRTVPAKGPDYDGWLYRLRVHRVFRGKIGETLDIFTENSTGRFPLEVGHEYLLFAGRGNGRLVITNCGNSGLLTDAAAKIRDIERIGKGSAAEIEGRVVSRPPWEGVPGIRVSVRGELGTYAAVTGGDGWFRLTVEPGRYSVKAESERVSPFDLSYDDPDGFRIPRGGCAQVQFVADTD